VIGVRKVPKCINEITAVYEVELEKDEVVTGFYDDNHPIPALPSQLLQRYVLQYHPQGEVTAEVRTPQETEMILHKINDLEEEIRQLKSKLSFNYIK
jgi:hypothetical protein